MNKEIIIKVDDQEYELKKTKINSVDDCKKCALLKQCHKIDDDYKHFHKLNLCNKYYGYWIKKGEKNTMTEQELIERCKIYLNWLDLYMTTDQGKVLWNAAAPYIYEYKADSMNKLETVFKLIINYYFEKSDDKFDNCIDNIMLNYFMLNYCIINEPTLCERYGKAILDNAEYFKQSPAFQEYLKDQESKEVGIDFKKENEFLKRENKVIRKALELVCKKNYFDDEYLDAECPYFCNHLPEFKVWENPCSQVCTVKEGHHYLCWRQHFLNIAIKELDKKDPLY